MHTVLVLRHVPFRSGLDLILSEAAALVAWGLEHGHAVGTPTWLRIETNARRLAVGVEVLGPAESLPEGLTSAPPPRAPGEPVELDLEALRLGTDGWIRIDHDPNDGRPLAAFSHPLQQDRGAPLEAPQ